MGVQFEAKFANFYGYLTDGTGAEPPRSDSRHLSEFLKSIVQSDDLGGRVSAGQRQHVSPIIISSAEWAAHLRERSNFLLRELVSQIDAKELLSQSRVAKYLKPLREFFQGYRFYGMTFSASNSGGWALESAQNFFQMAAVESSSFGLFFNPINYDDYLDFIDPFPCVSALARSPVALPAVVFWTAHGSAIALPIDEADDLFRNEIIPRTEGVDHLEGVLLLDNLFRDRSLSQRTKRILHMSDLHFGKTEAKRRRRYLKSELEFICDEVDRVVITGDLFDNPDSDLRAEFDEFKADVERFTKKSIITIPGNHDVRTSGNKFKSLGENYKHVADLWEQLVVDDDLRVLFFNFDSCEGGDAARGRISEQQRLNATSKFNEARSRNREIAGYTKIALVHHHPLPFQDEPEPSTAYQRFVELLFKPDSFVAFENADEFNDWCDARGISLVLHGHKHFPRQAKLKNGTLVVGCGSTTGVEGQPMCYDIVTLNEKSQDWSVSFFQDRAADGSGFKLQSVTLEMKS